MILDVLSKTGKYAFSGFFYSYAQLHLCCGDYEEIFKVV